MSKLGEDAKARMRAAGRLGQVLPSCVRALCRCLQDGVSIEVVGIMIDASIELLEDARSEYDFAFIERDLAQLKLLRANIEEVCSYIKRNVAAGEFASIDCRYRSSRIYPGKRLCWGCSIVRRVRDEVLARRCEV